MDADFGKRGLMAKPAARSLQGEKYPPSLQKRLNTVIQDSYHGDLQIAMSAFLGLHEKYGWKEQLRLDVSAIRAEVRRRGGVTEKIIDEAVKRRRKQVFLNVLNNLVMN